MIKPMERIIILCGGKGSRLRPLTSNLPKPLIPLHGKPVLEHIIEFYIKHGFKDFILCVGYCSEAVKGFVKKRGFDARIDISDAGEKAGILKRLHMVKDQIGEKAIVTYGDTYMNIDIAGMMKEHEKRRPLATITIADVRSPFGLVGCSADNRVTSFQEKPNLPYYIGHMVLERMALEEAKPSMVSLPDGEGLISLFQDLIKRRKLLAYKHEGLQITFNTLQEYREAETEFVKFFTQREEV